MESKGSDTIKNFVNSDNVNNDSDSNFFLDNEVKKGYKSTIRERFDTILKARGLKWSNVYNKVGLYKSYASLIRNGHMIPPAWLRIRIASEIGCDTSVLWEAPEIISADKINEVDKNEG